MNKISNLEQRSTGGLPATPKINLRLHFHWLAMGSVSVDAALTGIDGIRISELGAVQNRFESTIANLSTTSENLSAANSRIRDADFAKETAELSRTQVLQQAGMSVLSQANAQPQNVLQLLQG